MKNILRGEEIYSFIASASPQEMQEAFENKARIEKGAHYIKRGCTTYERMQQDLLHLRFDIRGCMIGDGDASVRFLEEQVRMDRLFPLARLPKIKQRELKQKGIGTLALLSMVRCLEENYIRKKNGFESIESFVVDFSEKSDEGEQQLSHIGIEKNMKFGEYLERIVDYASKKGFNI